MSLPELDLADGPLVLVVGSEGKGLSRLVAETCDVRVAIPMAFHAHRPFPIATHPSVRIRLVYVPHVHNALGHVIEGGPSSPEVFEVTSPDRVVIHDLGNRAELWERSLMHLSSMISQIVYRNVGEPPLKETDPATAALTRELIAQFRQEYDAFITRYRGVRRPMPTLRTDPWTTEDDKRRWKEAVDASFAREPNWDQYLARLFSDELKAMGELERELGR